VTASNPGRVDAARALEDVTGVALPDRVGGGEYGSNCRPARLRDVDEDESSSAPQAVQKR
jgi:hypothetical protein